MPGASWMGPGKPLAERSTGELVGVFVVLPILFGGFTLFMVVINAAANAGSFTLVDWLGQVVLAGLLSMGVAVTLPAVAWQELRRRRRERRADQGVGSGEGRGRAEPAAPADDGRDAGF